MKQNRFTALPLGSVQARGFLLRQLQLQRDNFTGRMEELPDYGSESGWLGGTGESWERGPYYVRGLVALAYCLGDEALICRARKWIDYALDSQTPDGNFGPRLPGDALWERREEVRREWWAKMPMLDAIRAYYEAERARGFCDDRVLPFFERYFRFQLLTLEENPLSGWAKARGADNVENVLWFYEQAGEPAWALELADLLLRQTFDWTACYRDTNVRHHVVNTTQGFKHPYLRYRLTGEDVRGALWKGLDHIRRDHGRIDDLPNADEAARDNLFTRGTESCAVAEAMRSMEICGRVDGDTRIYDLLETYAHNSLPNCFTYDLSRHCYFQLQNQIMATVGTHGFDCDHGDSCAFGAPAGFDCCFANLHMAYPLFVQNMWQRTPDGLAVACYGENEVTTDHQGRRIGFRQETRYPFGDAVTLFYTGEEAEFTLSLRVPSWSQGETLRVNGTPVPAESRDGYLCMTRRFSTNDRIEVEFTSRIRVIPWHFGAAAIRKGAVLYCLPVREEIRELSDETPYREIKIPARPDRKVQEIFPAARWNYALDIRRFVCREGQGEIRLTPDNAPVYLKAWGTPDPFWSCEGNTAAPLPDRCLAFREGELEELTLIPYACTRLKIALFPRLYPIGENVEGELSCTARRFCGCVQVDFGVLPEADEFLLLVREEKDVLYRIPRNLYKGGTFAQRDRFTFSCSDASHPTVQLLAYRRYELIAKSRPLSL